MTKVNVQNWSQLDFLINNFYEIIKQGCDHHPHGLEDCTPLIAFAKKYYQGGAMK